MAHTHEPAIDLRSDTVTRPTAAMREAMAVAPVGDDQYGEDPTANELQRRVAGLLGKESALWLPSGTMANQVALRVLTRPGDDVVVSPESHAVWHETGAGAANAGVQFTEVGARGVFTAEAFVAACKPRSHVIYPPTTLVEIENTHNRAGGVIFPQAEIERICAAAREREIATFLDGARLWNAAIASRRSLAEPVRYRRMAGGAMRQVGIFAAAGIYALDRHMDRLAEDHANARLIAERLAGSKRVIIDLAAAQTNILVFGLAPEAPDAATVVARAKERGVLIFAFGPRTVRAVTHLDVTREQCERAAQLLVEIVEGR